MKMLLKSNLFGLGVLLGLSFILIYITDKYILSLDFYNNSGDIFSGLPNQEAAVYDALQKWIYFSDAIYTIFKILVITLILHTALYLSDELIPFGRILNIVIYAEYVFLIPAAIKIPWFLSHYPNGNIMDWHRTYILSAISIFNNAAPDWYYPLQTFNVFEIIYWFLLAYGLSRVSRLDFGSSLEKVLISYVPALVIWVAAISFCTLAMFPNNG